MGLANNFGLTSAEIATIRESLYSDTTVSIRYINDFKNQVQNKDHTLYGGLTKNAVIGVPAPINMGGTIKGINEIFTIKELQVLAIDLHNEDVVEERSIFWKDNVFDEYKNPLSMFPILLSKEGITISLDSPEGVIKSRILKESTIVAESIDNIHDRPYRFYMINSADVMKARMLEINDKKKASILYGKISEHPKVLHYVIAKMGVSVGVDSTLDFLQSECFTLMENKPKEFVIVAGDELIKHKIIINDFVMAGLVVVKDGRYFTKEGTPLNLDNQINDLQGAAVYLNSGVGNATFTQLHEALQVMKQAQTKQ